MSATSTTQAFSLALDHHRAGRLPEAEALYRQILATDPRHGGALHHLGLIAFQVGQAAAAVELISQAAGLQPDNPALLCDLGEAFRGLRRLDDAAKVFRQALALAPDHPNALGNLGNVLGEQGHFDEAISCYRRAIARQPDSALPHYNLGNLFAERRQFPDAIASYRRALALRPDFAEAHDNLGSAFKQQGLITDALAAHRRALAIRPRFAEAQNNLGTALLVQGHFEESLLCFQNAVALKPGNAEIHGNLGNALRHLGRLDEALASLRRALELNPRLADAHNHLGSVFRARGQFDEADASYQRALDLAPHLADAHHNLGNLLRERGRLDEALVRYRQALALDPDFAEARNNLGNLLKDRGELTEALACFRQALACQPDSAATHSNLILTLHYLSGHEAGTIRDELRRWNRQHARPLAGLRRPLPNDRSPERRLRIGYVSPDFRSHPVGWFLRPWFAIFNREAFEVFCYSASAPPGDRVTAELRSHADGWREIAGKTDRQAADTIRADRIDILVDLALHTAKNRLPIFAGKPAPVQATYLAYPGISGVDTIDYRLTDFHLDPPAAGAETDPEQPLRLPESYWCYQPVVSPSPPVTPLPALTAGHVTFACLNNFCKVTPSTLEAWHRLLATVPTARLALHAPPGSARSRVADFFAGRGIDPGRLDFAGHRPLEEYFQSYQAIDIALDPFPFPGGTTTCDALWMGVPVVSLAGPTPVTRGGLSILSNVGLSELVVHTVDDYVESAAALARDVPRLAALRTVLRERMRQSPLMDAPRFARALETAYRSMWHRWCAQSAPGH